MSIATSKKFRKGLFAGGAAASAACLALFGAAACSGAPSTEAPGDGTPSVRRIDFEGHVDPASGTLEVVSRRANARTPDVTIPYGTDAGGVFFHTCSTSWNAPLFTGIVSPVNLTTGTIRSMNAVIDSVTPVGTTLAVGTPGASSGIMASYGNVAPNSVGCAGALEWAFESPSGAQFTFTGHADGAPSDVVFLIDGEGAIANAGFAAAKAFADAELGTLTIDSADDHVAVIQYATSNTTVYSLTQEQSPAAVSGAIGAMTQAKGLSYVRNAVEAALTELTTNGRGTGVAREIVLFAQGINPPTTQNPCVTKTALAANGVNLYVVGGMYQVYDASQFSCLVDGHASNMHLVTDAAFDLY